MNFIRSTVLPAIEKRYRAESDNRSYFGYSAGATLGSYILMVQPETFQNYILGSPALDGDIPILTRLSSNLNKHSYSHNNVFISHGDLEKQLGEDVKILISLLKQHKESGLSITHNVIQGEDHKTAFPLTGVKGLMWLSNLYSEEDA